jgi:hypothetical protein
MYLSQEHAQDGGGIKSSRAFALSGFKVRGGRLSNLGNCV